MAPQKKDGSQLSQLKDSLDEAEWSWLKAHAQRDGLIFVSQSLDLLQVGGTIAQDHSEKVKEWIQGGLLSKPTREQMDQWEQTPGKRFLSLVVQPYVLIQEILFH